MQRKKVRPKYEALGELKNWDDLSLAESADLKFEFTTLAGHAKSTKYPDTSWHVIQI